jgi:hypothetical protein
MKRRPAAVVAHSVLSRVQRVCNFKVYNSSKVNFTIDKVERKGEQKRRKGAENK